MKYFRQSILYSFMVATLTCLPSSLVLAAPGDMDDKLFSAGVGVTILLSPTIATVMGYKTTADFFSGEDRKVILQAKDDALSFVVSDGELRGVFLESALDVLTAHGRRHSDMELASWIAHLD